MRSPVGHGTARTRMTARVFPPDFHFGCATSAYQIEGGIENDWEAWAREGRLRDPHARCGKACDHWNRFESDFDLLRELGASAYRFSVEWARVEPSPGRFDPAALARYGEMAQALTSRGITPFVTFLHFTHPPWFHRRCPWHDPEGEGPRRFADFVDKSLEAFDGHVHHFTVLNEPNVWLLAGYYAAKCPPGESNLVDMCRAAEGLVRAHAMATARIRDRLGATAQVGIAHNQLIVEPSQTDSHADKLAAMYIAEHYNFAFLEALTTGRLEIGRLPALRFSREIPEAVESLDFIGVNYYTRCFVEARLGQPWLDCYYEDRSRHGASDLGWEVFPRGLSELLESLARYHLPLYVTENGLDDRRDARRRRFLFDHLNAVLDAREAGVDVRGYLHWSLIDNFEWFEAFEPRFGLYRVDYETQTRSATESAEFYRQVIRTRRLPREAPSAPPPEPPRRTPLI